MGKQELSKSLKSYCKGKDRSSESLLCAPVFRNSDPWEKVGHKHFLLLPAIDRVELGRTGEGRTGAKLCQVIQESQTCAALQGLLALQLNTQSKSSPVSPHTQVPISFFPGA